MPRPNQSRELRPSVGGVANGGVTPGPCGGSGTGAGPACCPCGAGCQFGAGCHCARLLPGLRLLPCRLPLRGLLLLRGRRLLRGLRCAGGGAGREGGPAADPTRGQGPVTDPTAARGRAGRTDMTLGAPPGRCRSSVPAYPSQTRGEVPAGTRGPNSRATPQVAAPRQGISARGSVPGGQRQGSAARSLAATTTGPPGSASASVSNADGSSTDSASSGVACILTSKPPSARRYVPTDSHSVTRHQWAVSSRARVSRPRPVAGALGEGGQGGVGPFDERVLRLRIDHEAVEHQHVFLVPGDERVQWTVVSVRIVGSGHCEHTPGQHGR